MTNSTDSNALCIWRKNTEIIIAASQSVFAAFLAAIYFVAAKPVDAHPEQSLTGAAMMVFLLICVARLGYVRRRPPNAWFPWVSAGIDIATLTVIIMSYASQYDGFVASLKAPTFSVYFVLTALHAMRFAPLLAFSTGAFAAFGWVLVVSVALVDGAGVTRSYVEYVSTANILIGAEIEKIISLIAFAIVLAVGCARGKSVLEAEAAREKELSRAKSEFLANMSHEIRTPMNGLIGIGELLERTNLDRQQADYVRILRNSGDTLLTVINDILDISKIESGKLTLSPRPFCLQELLEDVAETHAATASKKGLEITVAGDPAATPFVEGDDARLRQVISNLVGNAVKFTESGHVMMSLAIREDANGEDVGVTIDVQDTGVGIAPENLKKIFNKFEQADNSITRKFGGTGLGLAIARHLLEAMDGNLSATSTPGTGSTFTAALTLPKVAPPALHLSANQDESFHGKRALVVDDLDANLTVLTEMLRAWNIAVEPISCPLEAVTAVTRNPRAYDIVLMDYNMPKLNGVEAARKISDKLGDAKPPILLLTSVDYITNASELKDAGIEEYMIKPLRRSRLLNLLRKYFARTPAPTAANDADFVPPPKAETARSTTMPEGEKRKVLVAEDNEINRTVISLMLKPLAREIIIAEDGVAALEKFKQHPDIDCILMDVSMPVLDGLAATRNIREFERLNGLAPTPIIGVTAHAQTEEQEKALQAGMDECLTKPVKRETLERVFARLRAPAAAPAASATVPAKAKIAL